MTDGVSSYHEGLPPGAIEYADGHYLCPRCKCCDLEWMECCETCGGEGETPFGYLHEIDPLEYDVDDADPCDVYDGTGGWWVCGGGCDEHGQHQPDRRAV